MAGIDAELARKELIGALGLVLELDRKPDMLRRMPRNSLVIDSGRKSMIVQAKKDARILLL